MEGRKEQQARELEDCPEEGSEVAPRVSCQLHTSNDIITRSSAGSRRETQNSLRNDSLMHENTYLKPSRSQSLSLSVIKDANTL